MNLIRKQTMRRLKQSIRQLVSINVCNLLEVEENSQWFLVYLNYLHRPTHKS